ncbi:MAG: metallopeptidase family protein [Candidatus Omnitrophota bacterium]
MNIDEQKFAEIVNEAIDALPEAIQKKMHNVAILVEDFPTPAQMHKLSIRSKYGLFGLYEGYIQSSRRNFGPVTPDKITIFRMPIIKSCSTIESCRQRIISTVKHEIAHHFGSDEKGARKATNRRT